MEYKVPNTLKGLIERYSEFVQFPIYLKTKKTEEKEVDLSEEEIAEAEIKNSELPEAEQKTDLPKTKKVSEQVDSWD